MKDCKKRTFADKIIWRIRGLWCLFAGMIVYMIVIGELGLGDSRIMTSLAETVSRIIFFGGMGWVFWKIRKNNKLLENPWKLKEQAMLEQDERNRWLYDKSGGIVWDVMFVCLLFATLTTSLMNMSAFYVSLALLCIAVVLKVLTFWYYEKTLSLE